MASYQEGFEQARFITTRENWSLLLMLIKPARTYTGQSLR